MLLDSLANHETNVHITMDQLNDFVTSNVNIIV